MGTEIVWPSFEIRNAQCGITDLERELFGGSKRTQEEKDVSVRREACELVDGVDATGTDGVKKGLPFQLHSTPRVHVFLKIHL